MALDSKTLSSIRSNRLFESINPDSLTLQVSNKDIILSKDGDIIYQIGDNAEHIYLLLEGAVKIKHTVAIDGQRIFEKGPGEFFGEREFLDKTSRTSSAVAIRDSRLAIIRRKELSELFNQHRSILNNIQGTGILQEAFDERRQTREEYPAEISSLLHSSESALDPFAYRSPSQSVDMFQAHKTTAEPEVQKPVDNPSVKMKTIEDEFPHRFNKTFEDSFTFGESTPIAEAIEEIPNIPEMHDDENSNTPAKDSIAWDFNTLDFIEPPVPPISEATATELESKEEDTFSIDSGFHFNLPDTSEPLVEMPEEESPGQGVDFDSIQNDSVPQLGFKFPHETVEISSNEPVEDSGLNWSFESPENEQHVSPVPFEDSELPEEEEKFTWDFSIPEEDTGSEKHAPSDELPVRPAYRAQDSVSDNTLPQSESNDKTSLDTVSSDDFHFDFSAQAEAVVEKIPEPDFAFLDDDLELPIKGGTFDEFGNLIPELAEEEVAKEEETQDNSSSQNIDDILGAIPFSTDFPLDKVEEEIDDQLDQEDVLPAAIEESEQGESENAPVAEILHDEQNMLDDSLLAREIADAQMLVTELHGESIGATNSTYADQQFGKEGFTFTSPLQVNSLPAELKINDTGLTREQLHLIIEAAQLVNSHVKLDQVLNQIVQAASALTGADRGTLYIVDNANCEVWSKVIRGDEIEEIRLKFGQGIAGWVAEKGEIVNQADVSVDTRFEPTIDKVTGYRTLNMLCYPIKNKSGIIVAVIQLLNSRNGRFSALDETFLEALSSHIAIALENAELVEQILKTDRLSSLGKVAKFLISDIKKPILTIKQLAEHIKKKNVSPEINQVLSLMIEQSNIVADLVLTTLSYSEGKTVLNKKVLSLHRVLDELLDLLAEYVEYRKTKLFKKYGPDVLVNVDRREMYQAFFQITKNACDSMPQGGDLYVNARLTDAGNVAEICFKDKGTGIAPGILERIFEPFMSIGKTHGVGLGLPITEKIIKEHEGTIKIESKEGEGTSVTILLPVVKEF
ncbi:MAG: cyclic nucleotide-binding domain-containing protein [Ignavibacteria bacterium]|nr:cyclic nucleotide-binding domain-containing protein [Ignavibacteria bacterium]